MQIEQLFVSPIAVDFIFKDKNQLLDYCYANKESSNGRVYTNCGGWQSNDLETFSKEFSNLLVDIDDKVNELHVRLGLDPNLKQSIKNVWININGKGHYNTVHAHPGAIFSGVFYIQCNNSTGNLNFIHPSKTQVYHIDESVVSTYNNFTSNKHTLVPKESMLVIFPSWMEHYVEPNQSDIDRISIAFNTNVN